jgi:hypothetical protein
MMRLMANAIPPTREELARVLDDVFRRVLDEASAPAPERAEREAGAPDWTPEPQTDPRYEGLEPEPGTRRPAGQSSGRASGRMRCCSTACPVSSRWWTTHLKRGPWFCHAPARVGGGFFASLC